MKKIYTRILTLTLISATSITGFAQTDEQVKMLLHLMKYKL